MINSKIAQALAYEKGWNEAIKAALKIVSHPVMSKATTIKEIQKLKKE